MNLRQVLLVCGLAACLCHCGNLPVNAQAPTPAAPGPASPQTNQTNAPAGASADAKSKVIKETNEDGSLRRITGKAKVLDAHTLVFADGTEVDLNGVMDAPDLEQKAMLEDTLYDGGKVSAAFLTSLIGEQTVTFLSFGGKAPRPRGNCYAGETYLQEALVRHGWAVSSHSNTELAQFIAQEKKRGLWRGKFVTPSKWRKGERLPGE